MPIVNITLNNIYESFTRPMIHDILDQLKDIVKIPKDTHIFYPGQIEVNPANNSSIHEEHTGVPRFSNDRYIYIEVQEDYDVEELGTMATHQYENIVVYEDRDIPASMWPIYMKTDYTINIRYETISKVEADRWIADMRVKTTQMRTNPIHSVSYHYQIPEPFLELLNAIYEYKKRLDITLTDLDSYIKANFTNRLTKVTDISTSGYNYIIGETQSRIVGFFENLPMPEKIERNSDTGGWLCTFSYKVSILKPEGMVFKYPLMVYNKLLDDKYIAFKKPEYNFDRVQFQSRTVSMKAMEMLEDVSQIHQALNIYVPFQIPDFDEFTAKTGPGGHGNILSVLVEVDETDYVSLFNLKEIDPYVIDEDIMEFIIESEWSYMTKTHQSILGLNLYQDYKFKSGGMLTMTHDLDIKSVVELDLTKIYHVVLSLCIDLVYLNRAAIDRLKRFPRAFVKIIEAVNIGLKDHPDLKVISRKNKISKEDFNKFYRFLYSDVSNTGSPSRTINKTFNRKDFTGFNTVQTSGIIAIRNYLR